MEAQVHNHDTIEEHSIMFYSANPDINAKEISPSFSTLKDVKPNTKNDLTDTPKITSKSGVIAYSNFEQNSRCNFNLVKSQYQVKWKSELNNDHAPRFILATEDRIIVETFFWQVFKSNGQLIKIDKMGTSHLMIDESSDKFFFVNGKGELVGYNLKDASLHFASLITDGDAYIRPLMTLHQNKMTIIGSERQLDPHRHHIASKSSINEIDLTNVLKDNYNQYKDFAEDLGTLYIPSTKTISASLGENLVVAYPDKILIFKPSFEIANAYKINCLPLSISTDEYENIYLLNESNKGKNLSMITKDGTLMFSVALPEALVHPPIIGVDNRIFVPSEKHIDVIDKNGEYNICYLLKNKFNGAVVTPDGDLLVCDGNLLVSFGPNNKHSVIYDFGDRELLTPPVITANQQILVASKNRLICLEAQ